MPYAPQNINVFACSLAGALTGMGIPGKIIDSETGDYANIATVAGAFAQQFDTIWAGISPNFYDIQIISEACTQYWQDSSPAPQTLPVYTNPVTYDQAARAIIALIKAGDNFATNLGIVFPSGVIPTTLAGDVNGPLSANTIDAITGLAGTTLVNCTLKFPNNLNLITARNAANTSDIAIVMVDAFDETQIGDPTFTNNLVFRCKNGAGIYFQVGGSDQLVFKHTVAVYSVPIQPDSDNTIAFGDPTTRWASAYIQNLNTAQLGGINTAVPTAFAFAGQSAPNTIALGTGGTTAISAAQCIIPFLLLTSVALTSNAVLDFTANASTGYFVIDISGIGALGAFTLGFKNGTSTKTFTAAQLSNLLGTGKTAIAVATFGANAITIQ